MAVVVAVAVCVLLAVLVAVLLVSRLVSVAGPQEVLVVSGGSYVVGGKKVGYRIVQPSSRVVRIPVIEVVHRLDLTPIPIELAVHGAYTRDNVAIDIEGAAAVGIARTPPSVNNAVERFLGRSRSEIGTVARETLEGVLRSQVASHTVEEVRGDRLALAEAIGDESAQDFDKLGLRLERLTFSPIDLPEGVARPHPATPVEPRPAGRPADTAQLWQDGSPAAELGELEVALSFHLPVGGSTFALGLSRLDREAGTLDLRIAVGKRPRTMRETLGSDHAVSESAGQLLNQPVTWAKWTEADGLESREHCETVVDYPDTPGVSLGLHLVGHDERQLDTLRAIVGAMSIIH